MTRHARRWRRLRLALVAGVLALSAAVAAAQTPPPGPPVGLEDVKTTLSQVENALAREGVGDDALVALRESLTPLRETLRTISGDFGPKFADIETRLKQLGPAPEDDAPAEDPALARERAQLTKQFSELDAAIKQARLLDLRIDQLSERIVERRRAIFSRELFSRSASLVAPAFWSRLSEGLSSEARSLAFLGESLRGRFASSDGRAALAPLVAAMVATLALAIAVAVVIRRRVVRRREFLSRFAKVARALLILVGAGLPALVALVGLWTASALSLLPPRVEAIGLGLSAALAIAGLGCGLALGLFAPTEPGRRLVAIEDRAAVSLARHFTFGQGLLAVVIFLNVVHKELFAPVILTVATSAMLALGVAAMLLHALFSLRRDGEGAGGGARTQWVRLLALLAAGGILGLLVGGYVGLASFIANRLLTLVVVAAAVYLLLAFVDALFAEELTSDNVAGRAVSSALGLAPRSIDVMGVLLSGVLRAAILVGAVLLVIGPWGFFAADFFGALEGAVFGFKIGEITISLTAIFGALAVVAVGLLLTRAFQHWLQAEFLPRTAMDASLQLSITTICGYLGVIAVVALAMSALGIDLQKIALVAGALSVGIGFGLQSIVSNFVSGLILLAERPIRVGDSIVVKGEEGYVRRISVRATEIETFERASVIVPNSELITGVVKNWTRANTTGRVIVKVGVAYASDPEQVRDILLSVAHEHPQILQTPPPRAFLVAFGDSALEFELRCVVANVDYALSIKSDLHFAVLRQFREARIDIPYPQHDVRVLRGAAGEG